MINVSRVLALIAIILASIASAPGAARQVPAPRPKAAVAELPPGFTVQHVDGVTYVCSTRPVFCTGNHA
jgi:hypothetical protein